MEYKLRRDDSFIGILMKPVQWALHHYYDIHIEKGENIPKEGPALILSKHLSWVDIPLVAMAIYEASGRHANYIMRSFLLNPFYKKLGGIPLVRPKDLYKLPKHSRRKYLKKAHGINDKAQDYTEWLYSQNELIVVYPEGERSKDNMRPENGVCIMKPETSFYRKFIQYPRGNQIPIIPLGIEYEELPRRGSKVYIRVGEPINLNHDNIHVVVEEISNQIKDSSGIQ